MQDLKDIEIKISQGRLSIECCRNSFPLITSITSTFFAASIFVGPEIKIVFAPNAASELAISYP